MVFDIILMNPPYSQTLHEKFLLKSIEMCSDSGHVVSVEPATWLLGKKKNKELCRYISLYKIDIESINGIQLFDADIACQMTINSIDKSIYESKISFNNKGYESVDDIMLFSTNEVLTRLYEAIKKDIKEDSVDNHIKRAWKDNPPKEDSYIVRVAAIRGHLDKTDPSGKMKDFYTVISNDDRELSKTIGSAKELYDKDFVKLYFELDSYSEAQGLVNYFKTYFFRSCLALLKQSVHLDSGEFGFIPWQDFKNNIFNSSISDTDNYLFKKYNILDSDIEYLKSMLGNYYNI